MVYSVFYYAMEAITRAVMTLVFKLVEMRRRAQPTKRVEKPTILQQHQLWGFARVSNYGRVSEYVFVPRATRLRVSIPELIPLNIEHREVKRQPERLFFTFNEVASKEWFKSIEYLAEQLEKRGGR